MLILCRRCCLSDVPTCWFTSQCVSMHAALPGSGSPPQPEPTCSELGSLPAAPLAASTCFPLPVFIPLLLLKLVLDHGTIIAPRRCPLDLPSIPLWVISTPVSVSFKTYRWPRFSRSIFWFAHAEHWNLYYISHTRWTQSTLRSSLTWDFLHVRIKFIENYWPCVLE